MTIRALPTLSSGNQGKHVAELQNALNRRGATQLAPLREDGIFGPKTLARVREFQSRNQLKVDGIVGPRTWDALQSSPESSQSRPARISCGTGDPRNRAIADMVSQDFLRHVGTSPPTAADGQTRLGLVADSAANFSLPSGSVRTLSAAERAVATSVFGTSLDLARVFISTAVGIGNRAFVMAIPAFGNTIVQIMNLGTRSPSPNVLVHELTHVWQSQHYINAFQFMINAPASQFAALSANQASALLDSSIRSASEFPSDFPFSAYAFTPGTSIAALAAEQFA